MTNTNYVQIKVSGEWVVLAGSAGTALEAEAIRAECARHGDEAVVANVAAEHMAQEYTRSTHPTAT